MLVGIATVVGDCATQEGRQAVSEPMTPEERAADALCDGDWLTQDHYDVVHKAVAQAIREAVEEREPFAKLGEKLDQNYVVCEACQRYTLPENMHPESECCCRDCCTIDRLEQWVNDLQSGMYVNCVYCGHRYGPSKDVPAAMADVLKQHIEQCPEHPMSAIKAENVRLLEITRKADQAIREATEGLKDELRRLGLVRHHPLCHFETRDLPCTCGLVLIMGGGQG